MKGHWCCLEDQAHSVQPICVSLADLDNTMKSVGYACLVCLASAEDSTSMLQTGSHQALLDRASQSTINNVIAEFLSLPIERRQALLKLADTKEPDAVLANWLSLPVQQRNELIELARSGSVEGSTQMKGKKKTTCSDQLDKEFGDESSEKLKECKKTGRFKEQTNAGVITLAKGDDWDWIDDDKDLSKCDDAGDVMDWCFSHCYEKLEEIHENVKDTLDTREKFCKVKLFGDVGGNLAAEWSVGDSAISTALNTICGDPAGTSFGKAVITNWCTDDE